MFAAHANDAAPKSARVPGPSSNAATAVSASNNQNNINVNYNNNNNYSSSSSSSSSAHDNNINNINNNGNNMMSDAWQLSRPRDSASIANTLAVLAALRSQYNCGRSLGSLGRGKHSLHLRPVANKGLGLFCDAEIK
jgi:hypothetical protein